MKIKAWLKYLVYIVILFGIVYLKAYVEYKFQYNYAKTFKINYVLYVVKTLMMVVIGVIFGLEHFVKELKKEGKWKVNVPKFVLMGIPSLYITSLYFLVLIENEKVYEILIDPIIQLFKGSISFILIFEVALGYFLITSFYKKAPYVKDENSEENDAVDMENGEDTELLEESEEEIPD